MQFEHTWEKVLSGEKTQTRRLISSWGEPRLVVTTDGEPAATDSPFWNMEHPLSGSIEVVTNGQGRAIYEVGKTYAVQPGRNQKAIGRILLTAIRREDVRSITLEDAISEGFPNRLEFWKVWCAMHDKVMLPFINELHWGGASSKMWNERPAKRYDAWVLEFELVK